MNPYLFPKIELSFKDIKTPLKALIIIVISIPLFNFGQDDHRLLKGSVKEAGSDLPIAKAEILINGSDGSSLKYNADSNGIFQIPLEENVIYQISVNSSQLNHPCSFYPRKRHSTSNKHLIPSNQLGIIKKDILLSVIETCIMGTPQLFKTPNNSNLTMTDTIRLNGLLNLMKDNPTLTISGNHYNASPVLIQKSFKYLLSHGINRKRLIASTSQKPFAVSCHFEWNNKVEFPDLKENLKITPETIKMLSQPTAEFMKKYLSFVSFHIESNDFKP